MGFEEVFSYTKTYINTGVSHVLCTHCLFTFIVNILYQIVH